MRFFKSRPSHFLEPEQEDWQIETLLWLAKHMGGTRWLADQQIVLPNRQFFPATDLHGHEKACFVLDCVRRQMAMRDWPCNLIAQPERPDLVLPGMPFVASARTSRAAGTFAVSGNTVDITYDPGEINSPWRLIAIMAHELAHYRLATIPEPPPGAPDLEEPATDLTTIAFGFGLFGANVAFDFRGHQDYQSIGWRTSRLGYLREREWIFGLAIMLEIGQKPSDPLRPYLKDHLWSDLASARKSLRKRAPLLTPFRA
jgi:hypothetical protein